MNPRVITQGEEVMTDFQFKTLLTMVKDMLKKCSTIEEAEETITRWIEGEPAAAPKASAKTQKLSIKK